MPWYYTTVKVFCKGVYDCSYFFYNCVLKQIPTLRVALRVRLRYAPLGMTGYTKPSPQGEGVGKADG